MCKRMFPKAPEMTPTLLPASPGQYSISWVGWLLGPADFRNVIVLRERVHVSVEVLHSLLVSFGCFLQHPLHLCFSCTFSKATWAGVRLSRWRLSSSSWFFWIFPIGSRSFALSLSFFSFCLVTPSSVTLFSFRGPFGPARRRPCCPSLDSDF